MKYPESIQIGGHVYIITIVDEVSVDEDGNCGTHHFGNSQIRVADKIVGGAPRSEQAIMETICHEICHAINYIYCHSEMDEAIVNSFSQGFFQVLMQLKEDSND